MRRSVEREMTRETEIIGFMTVLCYVAVLVAIALSVYSLMAVGLRAVEQQIRVVSSEQSNIFTAYF